MVLNPEIDPNLCRLCGKTDGLKVDIFDEKHNYQRKIHSLLPIAIFEYDPLPKKMCHRCMFQVDGFYEFRENCLKTEAYLKLQLPWMPRKSNGVNGEEPSLGTEPMVHVSSPTLNSFTMDQWFTSRKTVEAENEIEIIDVCCQGSWQKGRPPTSCTERAMIPSETESLELKSESEDKSTKILYGQKLLEDNKQIVDHLAPHKSIMKKCEKQKNMQPFIQEEHEDSITGLSHPKSMMSTVSRGKSSVDTANSSGTSLNMEVIDIIGNEVDNKLEKKQEQPVHKTGTGIKIKLVKENNRLLAVPRDQPQHIVEEEEELTESTLKLNMPAPEKCQEEGTYINLSFDTLSGSGHTSCLTPKGIAHVRKQMEQQQKKSLLSSASASDLSSSKGGCPSGCRRRNSAGKRTGVSRKVSKVNQKPRDSGTASKTAEGVRRVLAPKNALKVTLPKNVHSDGMSAVSDNLHRLNPGCEENLNSQDKNIIRGPVKFSMTDNTSNVVVQNETKEDRPGIIVTRIPSACDIYTCEACERMFVTRETAYGHICDEGKDSSNSSEMGAVGESPCVADTPEEVSDLYTCCVCSQKFSRNATLAAHLKSHNETWSESDSSDGCGALRDIESDSNDSDEHGRRSRRRRKGSRKTVCPRKSVKLSVSVSV